MLDRDHLRRGEYVDWRSSVLAGGFSGAFARTATAPLDTLKIRLQVSSQNLRLLVRDTIAKEGALAFWKGNGPGTIMYIVYGATQFGSYSAINNVLSSIVKIHPQFHAAVVGALAGTVSSLVSYPFDVLRTRIAADRTSRTQLAFSRTIFRTYHEASQIWHHEGHKTFFRGASVAVAAVALYSGILFGTYESIRTAIPDIDASNHGSLQVSSLGLASMVSAFMAKLLTFPLDTLRRRLQLAGAPDIHRFEAQSYIAKKSGIWHILKQTIQHEGWKAFYGGLSISLIKNVPTTAISLWSYEKFMGILETKRLHKDV